MRHGVILLPEHRWGIARERWVRAEQLGFDHAWSYDHLVWRSFKDKPWYSPMPTLTAAAMVTDRIQIGPMVTSPGIRHPMSFAQEIMTLDDISGGRVLCGVGAGAGKFDDPALGVPELTLREKADRFEEFVQVTDALLHGERVTHNGTYFSTTDTKLHPGCVQRPRPPLAVAASGPRGIRLAARHADIWITMGWPGMGETFRYDKTVPEIREQSELLDKECTAIGRDPATVRRLVVTGARIVGVLDSVEAYQDACGLFGEIGVTDMTVHWPRPDEPYQASIEVLEGIAETMLTPAAD